MGDGAEHHYRNPADSAQGQPAATTCIAAYRCLRRYEAGLSHGDPLKYVVGEYDNRSCQEACHLQGGMRLLQRCQLALGSLGPGGGLHGQLPGQPAAVKAPRRQQQGWPSVLRRGGGRHELSCHGTLSPAGSCIAMLHQRCVGARHTNACVLTTWTGSAGAPASWPYSGPHN
jgi:hypothetical protein